MDDEEEDDDGGKLGVVESGVAEERDREEGLSHDPFVLHRLDVPDPREVGLLVRPEVVVTLRQVSVVRVRVLREYALRAVYFAAIPILTLVHLPMTDWV